MKKTFFLFVLTLTLLLSSCTTGDTSLAFFEKNFRLIGTFSFPELSMEGKCAITPSGDGSIHLLSPESLRGITLYKEGNTVRFTLHGIAVTSKDTRLFDFFALQGATLTSRRQDRETVFLEGETAGGSFSLFLAPDGTPQKIVTEDGSFTVKEILP